MASDLAEPATRREPPRTAALPSGPRMPSAMQTAIWARNAQWMLTQCAVRFGDTFTLRLMREDTWVVVSRPEDVKQVFTGDPRVFHAGEGNRILLPLLGENSLLLLDDDAHMRQRRLLLPPFHGARMQRYTDLMAEVAAQEIATWPLGRPYRLRPRMQAITLEIILRAVFGLAEGERLERLRVELRRLLDLSTSALMPLALVALGPEGLPRFAPFARMMGRVDELLFAEIAARRAAADLEERSDILSLLLLARHDSEESGAEGEPMSDAELRDELMTLLVAGHETTATALAWAIERLTRHPEKLERLTDEVAAGQTEYLDAVVAETLRLRPVITMVARHLLAPVEIGGRSLPAGVTVAPSIYLMHRRPEIYPDPERFEPERFLREPKGTYTWIPFGGGVRRCLGAAFAQVEMNVVLSEIVRRYRPEPAREASEPNRRRAITETPRYDAEVVLR